MKIGSTLTKIWEKAHLDYERKSAAVIDDSTYNGALNFFLARYFFIIYSGLVVWLPYIPLDISLHPHPYIALPLRLGLSVLTLAVHFLKTNDYFLRRPNILISAVVWYALLAQAIINVTAGELRYMYVGGIFLSMLVVLGLCMIDINKIASALASVFSFALLSLLIGVNFETTSLQHSVLILIMTFLFMLLGIYIINRMRYASLEQNQLLKQESAKNEESMRAVSSLTKKAVDASAAKSFFLAKMSHEIRTPMNAINGIAELISRESTYAETREQAVLIKNSSHSLIAIINDILDFSKIESGEMKITPVEYFASSLVNDVVNIIKVRMLDSYVHFIVNLNSNMPNKLLGDEARIRQVLLNLLSNAAKRTEKGYVSFSIDFEIRDPAAGAVPLGTESDADSDIVLFFKIEDTGKWITPEHINFIHDENDLDSISIEGTGLEVPIAYELVKAMGGNISIQSDYGCGNIFTVELPQKILSQEKMVDTGSGAVSSQENVLVYDNRKIQTQSIASNLKYMAVPCTLALSAEDFREHLAGGNFSLAFVRAELFDEVRDSCKEGIKVMLIPEVGEYLSDQKKNRLVLPAYSLSLANVFTDNAAGYFKDGYAYSNVRFTAPQAKVLIVDDIELNLFVTKGLLKPYEMRLKLCLNGHAALDAIQHEIFDLILMDHMMPEMDGVETIKWIRKFSGLGGVYKNVPIVALTANLSFLEDNQFLESGFNDCVLKPIDTARLGYVLEKWIPSHKQEKISRQAASEKNSDVIFQPAAASLDINIDGLDTQKGLVSAGGSIEKYKKILGIFLRNAIKTSKEIEDFLTHSDYKNYAVRIHALKGICASIGAIVLSQSAQELENAANKGDTTFIKNNTGIFLHELGLFASRLKADLNRGADDKDEDSNTDRLNEELLALAAAIETMDAKGIRLAIDAITPLADVKGADNNIAKILERTLVGDYGETLSLIRLMLRARGVSDIPGLSDDV
ncbi:MAG: response regulator [Spirochaetes bacterium]|nr:response regulator [Spirochaetota bacterium]